MSWGQDFFMFQLTLTVNEQAFASNKHNVSFELRKTTHNQKKSLRTLSARDQSIKKDKKKAPRGMSAVQRHRKSELLAHNYTSVIERPEQNFISCNLQIRSIKNETERVSKSIDLDKKLIHKQIQGGQLLKPNDKCLTISSWLKNDQQAIKRQKNLFQFYMNQIKRKRDQKIERKMKQEALSSSPIIIKSVGNRIEEMSTLELAKMEEIFKMWRDNQKMAISGRALHAFKPRDMAMAKPKKEKAKEKETLEIKKQKNQERIQIKAWDNQKQDDQFI